MTGPLRGVEAFLAAPCLAAARLATVFFATAFFAGSFGAVAFLAADFLTVRVVAFVAYFVAVLVLARLDAVAVAKSLSVLCVTAGVGGGPSGHPLL